jgi:hypothetical protein
LTTGILAVVVSGFFATINLTLKQTHPGLTIILYGITLLAGLLIFFATRSLWGSRSDLTGKVSRILSLKEELDRIRFCTIRERQIKAAETALFRLNRKLLDYFKAALGAYCLRQGIKLDGNPETSEPVLCYKELLEEIVVVNQHYLSTLVIEENHLDQLNPDEFTRYREEKLSLLQTNAENCRNLRYPENICIIPLEELSESAGSMMKTLCYDEYTLLFNKFREISINENNQIRKKEIEVETILRSL